MGQIKAILFDMDGVLVNTEPLHFRMWTEAFGRRGLKIDYDGYKDCIGCTLGFLLELILKNYGRDFRKDDTLFPEAMEIKTKIVEKEGYPGIEGVREMLERMKQAGYVMAIASSSPPKFIKMAMDNIGAADYFKLLNSGENVAHSKPAPDIYLDTAAKLGVDPSECIVLEDSTNGCRAAAAAGMICVGFFNPDSGVQDLSASCCVIDSMDSFTPELIEELGAKTEADVSDE